MGRGISFFSDEIIKDKHQWGVVVKDCSYKLVIFVLIEIEGENDFLDVVEVQLFWKRFVQQVVQIVLGWLDFDQLFEVFQGIVCGRSSSVFLEYCKSAELTKN